MKTNVVTISESASVVQAAQKMAESKVGSLIVEADGKLDAIVTERDLVRKCLAKGKLDESVGAVATRPLQLISSDADLSQAARMMGENGVKRLAVTKGGEVVGIIAGEDIVKLTPSLYGQIARRRKES